MNKEFFVEIVTPEKVEFSHNANSVTIVASTGSMSILADHAPIVATLADGPVVIYDGDTQIKRQIYGGFIEFSDNKMIILADKIKMIPL